MGITGRKMEMDSARGITNPRADYFYFSFYYFTTVCPVAEEVLG
jgi:hypothetical protein